MRVAQYATVAADMTTIGLANLACLAALAASIAPPAQAFTLADGTTMECVASGVRVPEVEVPADAGAEFTGRAVRSGSGYRILWNPARLKSLPPVMRDFLFFHECAHAQLGTPEELAANCAGLKAMRTAGRGGVGVESQLAAFYGAPNPYWVQTLACANAPDAANKGEGAPARPSP